MTKQNILQGLSEEAFTQMTPQARERALLQEMKSDHNLHPALYPHDKGPFTGHYKVTAQSHMIVWGCQRRVTKFVPVLPFQGASVSFEGHDDQWMQTCHCCICTSALSSHELFSSVRICMLQL